MDKAIQRLLEAHVRHELARFQSRKLQQSIREEVTAVFEWAKELKLGQMISAEQIIDLIGRNVVAMPLPRGFTELAVTMSQRVLAARSNKTTSIADICARAAYDAAVAKIGSMESFRQALIHSLVSSSIYTNQICTRPPNPILPLPCALHSNSVQHGSHSVQHGWWWERTGPGISRRFADFGGRPFGVRGYFTGR